MYLNGDIHTDAAHPVDIIDLKTNNDYPWALFFVQTDVESISIIDNHCRMSGGPSSQSQELFTTVSTWNVSKIPPYDNWEFWFIGRRCKLERRWNQQLIRPSLFFRGCLSKHFEYLCLLWLTLSFGKDSNTAKPSCQRPTRKLKREQQRVAGGSSKKLL